MGEPLVFVDVDTQRDFLDEDGALYVPGSIEIRPTLARLIGFAREHDIRVIATACAHRLDDPDPEPFPAHCLVGTPGEARIPETHEPDSFVIDRDGGTNHPAGSRHLTIRKRLYDVFSNPAADRVVEERIADGSRFVVFGVATDYCVRAAVLGLLARGARVAVVVDAIRAVDPTAEAPVLADFVRRGATLVVADRVCRADPDLG